MSENEFTALSKFSCPACGAEAVWTPAKKALVCPYCGTESPAELRTDGNLVEEHDLVKALRDLGPDKRGWTEKKKTVRCQSCQAITIFEPNRVAQNCDFCGSPALLAVDDTACPLNPGSLLPFVVPQAQVREQMRKWYGSHFWAPSGLGAKAMTDTVRGIYLPFWTFDSQVECPWQAEAGYYYYVRNSQGKQERRVRWQAAAGQVSHFFDDLLVPASKGVHAKLLHDLGPFPTTSELRPYDPGYLSGWVVEQYQIDLVEAASKSRERMHAMLRQMCSGQVPGDTQRNLRISPQYQGDTFKQVLLPIWLLTYQYRSKSYQVGVNGFTGSIAGEYPISWVKVMIAVVLGLVALAIFISLESN